MAHYEDGKKLAMEEYERSKKRKAWRSDITARLRYQQEHKGHEVDCVCIDCDLIHDDNKKHQKGDLKMNNSKQPTQIYGATPPDGDGWFSLSKPERLAEISRRKRAVREAEDKQRKQALGTLLFLAAAVALLCLRLAL